MRYAPAVNRTYRRWLAFAAAKARRLGATVKQAVLTDVDVTEETREADLAEAGAFTRSAGRMRGGMAKVAQIRAYLDGSEGGIAPEARAVFGRLWDKMPGDEPAAIRQVIVEDLGAPPEQLFARWDDQPIAAASLGQVHAAEDAAGAHLAVKVQYPGVAEALRADVASRGLLRRVVGADLGETIGPEALERLRDQLLGELDYLAEARNLERFAVAYAGDPEIVVPRVVRDRSAARVLTMERLEGMPLPELARTGTQDERNRVARTLLRFAIGAPLAHAMLNGDPNPGNYLVLDARAGRVGFVDFGCVVELPEELAAAERQLWLAMIHRDGEALRHAAHREGLVNDAPTFDGAVWREWERTLAGPFLARGEVELTPADAGKLIDLSSQLLRARQLDLPAGSLLLWRQRLGALSVIASLRPRLDVRRVLAELLVDRHPVPLLDRYP